MKFHRWTSTCILLTGINYELNISAYLGGLFNLVTTSGMSDISTHQANGKRIMGFEPGSFGSSFLILHQLLVGSSRPANSLSHFAPTKNIFNQAKQDIFGLGCHLTIFWADSMDFKLPLPQASQLAINYELKIRGAARLRGTCSRTHP